MSAVAGKYAGEEGRQFVVRQKAGAPLREEVWKFEERVQVSE